MPLQELDTIQVAENASSDLRGYDFELIFDDNLSDEFNKEKITEIFEILQVQDRNDLTTEFENIIAENVQLKVWISFSFLVKTLILMTFTWKLLFVAEWKDSRWNIRFWKCKLILYKWLLRFTNVLSTAF